MFVKMIFNKSFDVEQLARAVSLSMFMSIQRLFFRYASG